MLLVLVGAFLLAWWAACTTEVIFNLATGDCINKGLAITLAIIFSPVIASYCAIGGFLGGDDDDD